MYVDRWSTPAWLGLRGSGGLQGGRIIAVTVGTLALLTLVFVAHNAVYESPQGRSLAGGVFEALLFAALPVLVVAFLVTQVVERAGT